MAWCGIAWLNTLHSVSVFLLGRNALKCAVCSVQLGLETAHIELWQNTLVNSAEDCTAVHGSIVEYYAV